MVGYFRAAGLISERPKHNSNTTALIHLPTHGLLVAAALIVLVLKSF